MTDNPALKALADNGVSVWLDDLSRERIETGNLKDLIDKGVVGVTTNPSIFQAALSDMPNSFNASAVLSVCTPAAA